MSSFDLDYFRNCYGDYYPQSPARKSRLYLEMIRTVVSGGRLLDIGCSFGMFLREAVDCFKCTGMDVDQAVVAMAATNVPEADFVVGRLPHIPLSCFTSSQHWMSSSM